MRARVGPFEEVGTPTNRLEEEHVKAHSQDFKIAPAALGAFGLSSASRSMDASSSIHRHEHVGGP